MFIKELKSINALERNKRREIMDKTVLLEDNLLQIKN